jgi:hypothetical protein
MRVSSPSDVSERKGGEVRRDVLNCGTELNERITSRLAKLTSLCYLVEIIDEENRKDPSPFLPSRVI